ncbi:MAG: trehalose-6-phosphate synthase [Candidatus Methylomirabilales bacterium]
MSHRAALQEFVKTKLKATRVVVASNRAPYLHAYEGDQIIWRRPAGGLVVALDPVLRVARGSWVAAGQTQADRDVLDADGRVRVPPDDPQYTVQRVWLTREQEQGYYSGFSNEVLWPLCHTAFTRSVFRATDWQHYQAVNRVFVDAILKEAERGRAFIWTQDYHLALCPQLLKEVRPELSVAHFWHIPWPNPEVFRICPWRRELLEGLLGSDLLGFHIRHHCDNFLATVANELEAKIITEQSAVQYRGHTTVVKPFPISIDYHRIVQDLNSAEVQEETRRIERLLGRRPEFLAVGVDRIDYTKGIPERLQAIDRFLERYPRYLGRFVYLGIGAPSRIHLPAYKHLRAEIAQVVEEINWKYGTETWQPIVLLDQQVSYPRVLAYLAMADLCLVSALHDGMNLVAKEFIATQQREEPGVLILSRFTGAVRELVEALPINPYDTEGLTDAIRRGLEMPREERVRRCRWLQEQIQDHDIYRWALEMLNELRRVRRGRL